MDSACVICLLDLWLVSPNVAHVTDHMSPSACLMLPPPSSSRCTQNLLSTFLSSSFQLFFGRHLLWPCSVHCQWISQFYCIWDPYERFALVANTLNKKMLNVKRCVLFGQKFWGKKLLTMLHNTYVLRNLLIQVTAEMDHRYIYPPILHLASSEQWCWSGGRGILTELSLCYSIV